MIDPNILREWLAQKAEYAREQAQKHAAIGHADCAKYLTGRADLAEAAIKMIDEAEDSE